MNMNEDLIFNPMDFLYLQQANMQPIIFYSHQPMGFNIQPQLQEPRPPAQQPFITPNPANLNYQWGFLLENTLFTAFDLHNQLVLESSYRQSNRGQTKWIEITDSHLGDKVKVYFGVASNHLRMPGTRYNVVRQSIPARQHPSK